ncbi:MAG: Mov34/MPN/PAD-1 family protein [Chloroflexota bacterium]
MSEIEWHETSEYQPSAGLVAAFCTENHLSPAHIPPTKQPLVFIERQALEALYDFLAHDLEREHGGVLVGQPYYDSQARRFFIVVQAAVPAQETEGSSIHLQFTPDTWDYIAGIIEENFPELVIVGWYHSHPALGVFMSGIDRATQRAFYNHPWSLAVVVDPIAQQTGWFTGPGCLILNERHVIPFESPDRSYASGKSRLGEEYWGQQVLHKLRWLLPFGLLTLCAALLWWYARRPLA